MRRAALVGEAEGCTESTDVKHGGVGGSRRRAVGRHAGRLEDEYGLCTRGKMEKVVIAMLTLRIWRLAKTWYATLRGSVLIHFKSRSVREGVTGWCFNDEAGFGAV